MYLNLEFELFHIPIYLIYLTGIKNYKLSELTAISSGSKYVTLISNFNNLASVTGTIGDITCNLASKLLHINLIRNGIILII